MTSPGDKPLANDTVPRMVRTAFQAEIAQACKAHDAYLAEYGSLGDAVRAMEEEDAALAAGQRMRDRLA